MTESGAHVLSKDGWGMRTAILHRGRIMRQDGKAMGRQTSKENTQKGFRDEKNK